MTDNERDIITLLDWLIPATTKAPTDKIAAIRQRLVDQLLKAAAIDGRPDGERRAEFIEKMKGPKNTNGMVMGPPSADQKPDGELRREFLERQKRPQYRPSPPTGV
jgi:hypothetical protein